MYSTTRLYCSERFRSQDFGLKDRHLSSKRVPSCYIKVWMEFAIATFHCSHIRGSLDIIVYFKGFAFAAYWLCNRPKTDSHFITWLSFTHEDPLANDRMAGVQAVLSLSHPFWPAPLIRWSLAEAVNMLIATLHRSSFFGFQSQVAH